MEGLLHEIGLIDIIKRITFMQTLIKNESYKLMNLHRLAQFCYLVTSTLQWSVS